jgi:diguanylate cyclase (GGDEF)-like protein
LSHDAEKTAGSRTVAPRPARVHWIVRQNRRHRSAFYPLLAAIVGAQLHDMGAGVVPWLLLCTHFFAYPQLVYWLARRQPDGARQRAVELRTMVFDCFLYALWFVAFGFPLWPCFVVVAAATMSMVAYHGLRGVARVAFGLVVGVAAGLLLPIPFAWRPDTSVWVTALSMLAFLVFMLAFAHDAYTRTLGLYQSRQLARDQIDEIRGLQEQLSAAALRDPLTDLHNRRHLSDALPLALARCERRGTPLTLLMIDIDHFKQVNDRHGHAAGDAVLLALGQLMLRQVRRGDLAVRMGGEEFLWVLEDAGLQAAWERGQTLREAFAAHTVEHEDQRLRATFSCGVAVFPTHGGDADALLKAADGALYTAKANGRNQLQLAS